MDLSQASGTVATNPSAFTVAALAVAALSAGVSLFVLMRLNAAMAPFFRVKEASDDPQKLLPAVLRFVEDTEQSVASLTARLDNYADESRAFIRHRGLVRYDAFDDVGGQQSYSLCLLDADKNGVILTYLTGVNSARSYAVAVERGTAARKLSEEESRALEGAMSPAPVPVS